MRSLSNHLVLIVFGRIRIIAAAVAIPDRADLSVNDDFYVLPLGLLAGALNRAFLRVNDDACAVAPSVFVAQPSLWGTT